MVQHSANVVQRSAPQCDSVRLQDLEEAFRLYQEAARLDDPVAMHNLGIFCERGWHEFTSAGKPLGKADVLQAKDWSVGQSRKRALAERRVLLFACLFVCSFVRLFGGSVSSSLLGRFGTAATETSTRQLCRACCSD